MFYVYIIKKKTDQVLRGREIIQIILCQKKPEYAGEFSMIEETENGKPYFKNLPQIQFNLSDTEGYLAIIWNDEGIPVGIDIERKDRTIKEGIKERFFSEREREMEEVGFASTGQIWTRKEACVKASGRGLYAQLQELDTFSFPQKQYVQSWETEDLYCSICLENCPVRNAKIEKITFEI